MINWPSSDQWKGLLPPLRGRQRLAISSIRSASRAESDSLLFVKELTDELLARLQSLSGCLILLNASQRERGAPLEEAHGVVYCDDPRYAFAELLSRLWDHRSMRGALDWQADRGIFLGRNVRIDPTAVIEPGASVGEDCVLDAGVYVMSGARIGPRVSLGEGSVVRENAVLGGYGFGFALAEGKPTLRIPHVGGVLIGKNVEIGALSTVCAGTIDPTVVEDGVKIDDHVHVAHNCHIEAGAILTTSVALSGSVRIGRGAWLGPNCTVLQKLRVGANALIGIGAVVVKPVPDGMTFFGNPAGPMGTTPKRK